MTKPVRRYHHSKERGLTRYGTPVVCSYGTTARVYDSSVSGHVWLNVQCDPRVLTKQEAGEATMHLDRHQAQALVDRLSTWLDGQRPPRRKQAR